MLYTTRSTSSNLASVLSATALAVAPTAPASRSEELQSIEVVRDRGNQFSKIEFVYNLGVDDFTDASFVLDRHKRVPDESAWWQLLQGTHTKAQSVEKVVAGNVAARSNMLTPKDWFLERQKNQRISHASYFYESLADDLKTPVVEELVSLFFIAGATPPAVDRIDDMITIDLAAEGRLLGVLIDGEMCAISSFSRAKELKATYVIDDPSYFDEFKRVLSNELSSFLV